MPDKWGTIDPKTEPKAWEEWKANRNRELLGKAKFSSDKNKKEAWDKYGGGQKAPDTPKTPDQNPAAYKASEWNRIANRPDKFGGDPEVSKNPSSRPALPNVRGLPYGTNIQGANAPITLGNPLNARGTGRSVPAPQSSPASGDVWQQIQAGEYEGNPETNAAGEWLAKAFRDFLKLDMFRGYRKYEG